MTQTAISDLDGLMRTSPHGHQVADWAHETAEQVIDLSHTLETLEGDRAMVLRVIDVFLGELPELRRTLAVGVHGQECDVVARIGHRLRGSLSVFGASGTEFSVSRLEEAARAGESGELASLHRDADLQLARLGEALVAGRGSVVP